MSGTSKKCRCFLLITAFLCCMLCYGFTFECNVKCTEKSVCAPGDIPCIIRCSHYQHECCKDGKDICVDKARQAVSDGQKDSAAEGHEQVESK